MNYTGAMTRFGSRPGSAAGSPRPGSHPGPAASPRPGTAANPGTVAGTSPAPRSSASPCEAWQLLVRFFFAQRAHIPTLVAELQLSPAQCHLLRAIEPGRPIPMRHAAAALACDASNVTGLVDRLESRGLIRRRPSDADRRVTMLDLTPTGSRLRTLLLDRMSAPPDALRRLSARDQQALVRILTCLLDEQSWSA